MNKSTLRTNQSVRRRRLRLELLETRSLLTAAPWVHFEAAELFHVDGMADHHSHPRHESMGGDLRSMDSLLRSRNNDSRGERDALSPRVSINFDVPKIDSRSGSLELPQHQVGTTRIAQSNSPLTFATSATAPIPAPTSATTSIITKSNKPAPSVVDQIVLSGVDALEIEFASRGPTVVVLISATRNDVMVNPQNRTEQISTPNAGTPNAERPTKSNTPHPSQATQQTSSATPYVETAETAILAGRNSAAAEAADFSLANSSNEFRIATMELNRFGEFQSVPVGNAGFQSNRLGATFDAALKQLFPKSDQAEQLRELDHLLEVLADEHNSTDVTEPEETSLYKNSVSEIEIPEQQNAQLPTIRSSEPGQGGMISMNLPQDLLLSEGDMVDSRVRDQAAAWTASIGLYRAHEMAAANGGNAVTVTATNGLLSKKISSNETKSDEIISSRLRPIVAATSAAFGAIFVGLRSHRRKTQKADENLQRLA